MCFNQPVSFGFAAFGLLIAIYVQLKTKNTKLAIGVFWFFLMELLQGIQYFVINDCENPWNKFLTLIGFFHICYQPYFTHIINSSLLKNPKLLTQYEIILRLCLLGGTMLFLRYVFAEYSTQLVSSDLTDYLGIAPAEGSCRTTEWLRGEQLCTFSGKYHLAWSVPMYDPTYWSPSAAIHSFLMFGPFFVMNRKMMVIQGFVLWLAGPYLASLITPNLMEQASIWCFFSIAQIAFMLFLIRGKLFSPSAEAAKKGQKGQAKKTK